MDKKTYFSVKLRDYCRTVGCVLIAPSEYDDDEVLQNVDGKLQFVPVDDMYGLPNLLDNQRTVSGMIRKAIEMAHGGFKQVKLFF